MRETSQVLKGDANARAKEYGTGDLGKAPL